MVYLLLPLLLFGYHHWKLTWLAGVTQTQQAQQEPEKPPSAETK
jgi:hypothetical protein